MKSAPTPNLPPGVKEGDEILIQHAPPVDWKSMKSLTIGGPGGSGIKSTPYYTTPLMDRPERPNIVLTRDEWERLPAKAQWDIKAALRGPDVNGSEIIKYWTTSVIRYACSHAFRCGGSQQDQIPLVVTPKNAPSGHDPLGFNLGHFCEHVRTAAQWLGIYQFYLPYGEWVKAVQHGHPHAIGEALLKHADALPDWAVPLIQAHVGRER